MGSPRNTQHRCPKVTRDLKGHSWAKGYSHGIEMHKSPHEVRTERQVPLPCSLQKTGGLFSRADKNMSSGLGMPEPEEGKSAGIKTGALSEAPPTSIPSSTPEPGKPGVTPTRWDTESISLGNRISLREEPERCGLRVSSGNAQGHYRDPPNPKVGTWFQIWVLCSSFPREQINNDTGYLSQVSDKKGRFQNGTTEKQQLGIKQTLQGESSSVLHQNKQYSKSQTLPSLLLPKNKSSAINHSGSSPIVLPQI